MILKVSHFKQENSLSCGLACLRMVFAYYGDEVSEKELASLVKIHKFGTFMTDLGVIALKRGYKVKSYTMRLSLFSPAKLKFGTKITGKLLSQIKPQTKDKMTYETIKRYLDEGGELIYDTPKVIQLKQSLDNKTPAMTCINTAALGFFHQRWDNGHIVVVNRLHKDKVHLLDPDLPKDEASRQFPTEDFLPAWVSNALISSSYLMIIQK